MFLQKYHSGNVEKTAKMRKRDDLTSAKVSGKTVFYDFSVLDGLDAPQNIIACAKAYVVDQAEAYGFIPSMETYVYEDYKNGMKYYFSMEFFNYSVYGRDSGKQLYKIIETASAAVWVYTMDRCGYVAPNAIETVYEKKGESVPQNFPIMEIYI